MRNVFRGVVLAFITLSFVGLGALTLHRSARAADGVLLTGSVKSSQGEKMGGVTVSAKPTGSTIATSVFTDEDGNFYFPRLPEGQYRVWAQATGYTADKAELQLSGSVLRKDFNLKTAADVAPQLSGDQWLASLPDATKEDRRMKEILRVNCTGCHTPAFPLQNRFDEKGWNAILTLMSREVQATCYVDCMPGGTGIDQPPSPAVAYFKPELAAYLAKYRGPDSAPIKYQVRPRPSGDSTMAVITTYDVPLVGGGYAPRNGSDWSFGTPGRSGGVHDAQIDFNGNLWFSDWSSTSDRTVGKIDGKTGKLTNFRIPADNGFASGAHAIIKDEHGIIWFNVRSGEGFRDRRDGRLGRIDPNTDQVELFTPPADMPGVGDFLDWDGKGNIWMAAGGGESRLGLIRFEPATKKFTYYKPPVGEGTDVGNSGLYGVTGDSMGNGWWSLYSSDMEAKADTETGKVETVKMPKQPDSGLFTDEEKQVFKMEGENAFFWGVPGAVGPRRPGADKHGDSVWVPGWYNNTLIKIDIKTSKIVKVYPLPVGALNSGPYMAQVDLDHNVWIDYQNGGTVSKFDPKMEKWTVYYLPNLGLETHQIGILNHGPTPTVVVADARNSQLDKVQVRSKEELSALKAEAATVMAAHK
jgi:streptogramin lyase